MSRKSKITLPESRDPKSLVTARRDFIEHLKVNNFAPDSIRIRADGLRFFIAWAHERSIEYPEQVTRAVLERYKAYLYYYRKPDGTPLAFSSQSVRLQPLRTFFRWLAREGRIDYNPASELDLPKTVRRLPKNVFTQDEAEAIIAAADITTHTGLRDRAILETFYSSGIRRSELMHLSIYDVDTERGTVMVREGKGGYDRLVPLGSRAGAWVDKYLEDARPALVRYRDDPTLFVADDGLAFKTWSLGRLVKGYMEAVGIERTGACHLFRHTMATLMLEGGADLRYVQEMLGHRDLSTTEIYTKVTIKKLIEIHAATHPAKLGRDREAIDDAELLSSLAAEAADDDDDFGS